MKRDRTLDTEPRTSGIDLQRHPGHEKLRRGAEIWVPASDEFYAFLVLKTVLWR